MKRKLVGGLLVSFFVLFVLVIISLFVDFGNIASGIYTLFFLELFFFTWLYTRKISGKLFFRHFVGFVLLSFFLLLLAVIVSFFAPDAIPAFIYYLFAIDIIILIGLYLRKIIKKEITYVDKIGYAVSILIPLIILGYVVYMNWLPFGFEKTYVLDVGSKGDTLVTKQIYLEKSDALGEAIQEENRTYRTLEGSTNIVFKPKAVLKDAIVDIEIIGDDVYIVPPIEFDYSKYDWNLSIDFSKGIPDFLEGNAEFDEERKCVYFDGQSSLSYPGTHDQFEEGPFAVYVEWTPENDKGNFQQIIGHYNWELFQRPSYVMFRVGRMSDITGPAYSTIYPITSNFFNKKHSALSVYNPSQKGYMQLFVDNNFVGIENIKNETIWRDYNEFKPLSFGKSSHGSATHFIGCINKAMFRYGNPIPVIKKYSFYTSDETLEIPVVGFGEIDLIKIKVKR